MGKAGKWIKSLVTGGKKDKVDKEKETSNKNSVTPVVIPAATPKEKKRWSFRRSSATATGPKDSSSNESTPTKPGRPPTSASPHLDDEQQKPDVTVTSAENSAGMAEETQKAVLIQEAAAAIRIQSVFRSYLARKALRALRGLVKIQALVRGHLVRKHTTATLRRMQAIVTAQARARAHRIRSVEQDNNNLFTHHRHSTHKINNHDHFNFTNSSYQEFENGMMEESIKIVEMDLGGESKPSSKIRHSYPNNDRTDSRFSTYYTPQFDYINQDFHKISPAPSAITDISPRTCSGHFEDCLFPTAQSSPQCYYSAVSRPDPSRTPFAFPRQEYSDSLSYDYPLYPNYMANTQSSRAKARSQSAPKQRPESLERQLSKRRPSVEGRNIPRAVRMQRSSSQVGAAAAAQNY